MTNFNNTSHLPSKYHIFRSHLFQCSGFRGVLWGDQWVVVALSNWTWSTRKRLNLNQISFNRARFQLFGDIVNTAARMEASGVKRKIQCSATTAALLKEAGKEYWLRERDVVVSSKGKGFVKTYWVNPWLRRGSVGSRSSASGNSSAGQIDIPKVEEFKPVNERLVDWMTELLQDNLKVSSPLGIIVSLLWHAIF